jgi:hypothetical protein
MGLRPIERHPSRIISKDTNFLFFTMLQASKIPVDEVAKCGEPEMQDFDWDGVTHVHELETEESLIQIRTHYDEANDRYCLLDFTISALFSLDDEFPENPEDTVITVVSRGKTSEELQLRDELTDDNLAEVINIFKEMNN